MNGGAHRSSKKYPPKRSQPESEINCLSYLVLLGDLPFGAVEHDHLNDVLRVGFLRVGLLPHNRLSNRQVNRVLFS